jgi:hypothetical protein
MRQNPAGESRGIRPAAAVAAGYATVPNSIMMMVHNYGISHWHMLASLSHGRGGGYYPRDRQDYPWNWDVPY